MLHTQHWRIVRGAVARALTADGSGIVRRRRRNALRKRPVRTLWSSLIVSSTRGVLRQELLHGAPPPSPYCSELCCAPRRIPPGGPILSGCSPLCPPLVRDPVGSRWKCNVVARPYETSQISRRREEEKEGERGTRLRLLHNTPLGYGTPGDRR